MDQHAATQAEEAVRAARRSGSALALAGALSTRAFVNQHDYAANPLADAEEAERLARSCGSAEWQEEAAVWRVNSLLVLGRTSEATVAAREAFQSLHAAGSGRGYFLAALAAHGMLYLGRWNECRDLLRERARRPMQRSIGAFARLTSAQLAVRQAALRKPGST